MPHPLTRHLEPLTAFVLEAVCSDEGIPEAANRPPVESLIDEARRQMVSGALVLWAERQPPTPYTASLKAALAAKQQAQAMRALYLVGQTRALLALLQGAGIRAIPLKGPLLSKRLYGDYAVRHLGDIDLLVDPRSVPEADRCLRSHGHVRTKPRKDLSPRRLALYLGTQHEFGYGAPDPTESVELHWRYADCPGLPPASFEEVWSRTERVDVGGTLIPTLSSADTFLQLAIHGFTDGWSRLKWIADLPRAGKAVDAQELRKLRDEAKRQGFGNVVDLALVLAGRGGETWSDSLESALPYIAARLQNPHPRTMNLSQRLAHSRAARRFLHLVVDDAGLRQRMEYCNRIMPADFDHLPLPDTLTKALPYLAPVGRSLRSLW